MQRPASASSSASAPRFPLFAPCPTAVRYHSEKDAPQDHRPQDRTHLPIGPQRRTVHELAIASAYAREGRHPHPRLEPERSSAGRVPGTLPSMSSDDGAGIRERITRQGEDALGKLAQDLLENPLINGALARAFEAREKAVQAQEVAMGALNIPSAADVERLTRRLRSVSQRLEGLEDGVDRLDHRLASLNAVGALESRLSSIEEALTALTREFAALREALPDGARPVPREQERFDVESDGAKAS